MIIHFDVKEQQIIQKNKPTLIKDSKNYIKFEFNFNKTWQHLQKTITFKQQRTSQDIRLEADTITVPHNLMTVDEFDFELQGYDEENDMIVTTNTVKIKLFD